MKMYVLGVTRLKGVSRKTGNEYDFLQVDCIAPRSEGFGMLAAMQLSLDPRQLSNYDDLDFPVKADVDFNQRGRVTQLEIVENSVDAVVTEINQYLTA